MSSDQIEQTKQQIRGLVSEIATLAKSELTAQEFYPAFLQRVVSALAAVGGAVWVIGEGRRLQLAYHIKCGESLMDAQSDEALQHVRLLSRVIEGKEPALVPPMSGSATDEAGGNPTQYLLVLSPLMGENQPEGVLEVFQRADAPPNAQRGYLRFVIQMCELAGDWLKSRKLKQFSDRHSLWAQADHFARLVHESLDTRETAFTVVNEGRRLIGCDRVSVAIKRGRKCVIEAVSGQDTMENRSNIIAALANLATKVVATGEPLWYEGSTEDLPPQVEKAIDHYVEEAYARSVTVLPLRRPDNEDRARLASGDPSEHRGDREVIGAMIIEQIETDLPREVLMPRVDLVYEHAARAVSNSLAHNSLFLMPVWRTLGHAKWVVAARNLPKTLSIAGLVLATLLALLIIPGNFDMKAEGRLQPVVRRDVFTELDGDVIEVRVRHQQEVKEGDVLAVLRNTDLEVERERVDGERSTTTEQLASVTAQLSKKSQISADERSRLSGELGKLQRQIDSLTEQMKLIEDKRTRLTVVAPISGRVTTWDVENVLLNRPVQTGQVLMTIVDEGGDWELELNMPERRMGHLSRARQAVRSKDANDDLKVRYILASDSTTERHGKIKEIHQRTDVSQEEGHTVKIRVAIEESELQAAHQRPGTSVTANVHCGRRPIGYCWLHEAWEWVQRHVFF